MTEQDTDHQSLTQELDYLGERVDLVTQLISELRNERRELKNECQRLRGEHARLLEAGDVSDSANLLQVLKRLKELKEENRALIGERAEVSRRLGGLIEKVDLLGRDS